MRSPSRGLAAPLFQISLVVAVFGFGLFFDHASRHAQDPASLAEAVQAALERNEASEQVHSLTSWIIATGDQEGLPFVVIDKTNARLYAFGPLGQLRASAPVLLGAAHGDDPGPPATPAGRFVSAAQNPTSSGTIVWTHEGVELSLHPLPSPSAPGGGLERLASADLDDRRISEGSLHVARGFYREHIEPLRGVASVAYVLPETVATDVVFRAGAMRHPRIVQSSTRSLL